MTPVRMWIGLVLLALGVIGILEATGTGTGGVAEAPEEGRRDGHLRRSHP